MAKTQCNVWAYVALVAAFSMVFLLPLPAGAFGYQTYSNSHAASIDYQPTCAGTGGSCTMSWSNYGGGYTVCVADDQGGHYCLDYQSATPAEDEPMAASACGPAQ